MAHKEYIAYEGRKLTIEWYFNKKEQSQALDYFESLDDHDQIKLLNLIQLMGDVGKIHNKTKFNFEGDEYMLSNLSLTDFCVFSLNEEKLLLLMLSIRSLIGFQNEKKIRHLNLKKIMKFKL